MHEEDSPGHCAARRRPWRVSARAELAKGYAAYANRVLLDAELEQIMLPGVSVHGVVVDEEGSAVADAKVTALLAAQPFPD